ncbi:MAG: hypothetical protein QM477_01015 [Planctomycetota bacterium]
MHGDEVQGKGALDSALLFLSRDVALLAGLLERFLNPTTLQALTKVAGRRKAGSLSLAVQVSAILPQHPKLRRATVQALWDALPVAARKMEFRLEDAAQQTPEALLEALAADLVLAQADARSRVQEHLLAWQEWIPIARDEIVKPVSHKEKPDVVSGQASQGKAAGLKQQLLKARRAQAHLEEEIGRERKRRTELQEQLVDAVSECREAEARAANWKKKLADTSSASEREKALVDEAEDARQRLHLAQSKLDLLSWERDDLRACLEDRDRFYALEEENVPSFHNRPLLQKEQDLAIQMAATGLPFRVLVVGGGEPQFRHRDKLQEYAEVMGFHSTWRMAEYVSWHKEMDKLGTDMNTRYDALVILHWNRTTFTKKAREVCNQAGQKPCITCYYEGFTSLRETLQECLRQLLGRAES